MDHVDALADLLGWTGSAAPELSWAEVEADLGLTFPDSYKALLKVFPSGEFGVNLYVVSPVQDSDALAMFKTRVELTLEHWIGPRFHF